MVANLNVVAVSVVKCRRIIGYSILGCLAVYVLLSLLLIAFPKVVLINQKITRYYKWIALPGPYFRDNGIRSMGNFYFSYQVNGQEWSVWRNIEREHFLRYHESFFDYESLKRSRLERFMAQSLKRAVMARPQRDVRKLAAFRELHVYLRAGYLPHNTDSVRWMYVRSQKTGANDTLVNVAYKSF
jgi:hypothetical protein